jgi:diguanylate cyclase (GGDEF)-like protein
VSDSRIDAKTGLLNARTWEREAAAEVARAVRARLPLAVAVLDLDWFKAVNDTYGHLFGDEVLRQIGRCVPSALREYDLAGRFGGEEFVLLLPHTRAVDAFRIADRVRCRIADMALRAPGGELARVTASVGVATLDVGSCDELKELLAAADAALYQAKRDGRNQVRMISTARGGSAAGGPEGIVGMTSGGGPGQAFIQPGDAAPGAVPAGDVASDAAPPCAVPPGALPAQPGPPEMIMRGG